VFYDSGCKSSADAEEGAHFQAERGVSQVLKMRSSNRLGNFRFSMTHETAPDSRTTSFEVSADDTLRRNARDPLKAPQPEIVMDRAVVDDHGQNKMQLEKHGFGLPRISVIIVNYNYGRFLREAIDSVFAQTYPNIELVVVDDASVDESAVVLDAIAGDRPDIKIIRRQENGGQSLATRQGFEASTGEYVVFLDADDVLLSDFVATHIFVHLSLRIPVGFTSSDMAQASNSRLVLSTIHPFSDYIRSEKGKRTDLIRRVDENAPELWPLASPDADIGNGIHLVQPSYQDRWVWAPTSGNCFRRDALVMFFDNDALASLRSCTDAYLIRCVAVLTGSVLIDRPLSIYRLHGVNVFSQSPHLNGLLNYERRGLNNNDQKARQLVIDFLIAHAERFASRVHSPFQFLGALKALNDSWPRLPSRIAGCRSYVGGEVIAHYRQMAAAVGLGPLTVWTMLLGVAPWTLAGAWIKALWARNR
jgi:glycosyltransferase involved in cell wall biosynthesis